jgi:hypothetical protein
MSIRFSVTTLVCGALLIACGDDKTDAPLAMGGSSGAGGSSAMGGTESGGSSGGGVGGGTSGGGGAASGGSGGAGGDAVGGSGGAGGSGGSALLPAKPTQVGDEWQLVLGDVTLAVAPKTGGRITTLALGGENLLTGPEVNPLYWGSTLWISPEAKLWMQPPPAPIDSDPYVASATDTVLTLEGDEYDTLGISVTKSFTTNPAKNAFEVQYALNNESQAAVMMAPWEVTRVKPRGVTFFPKGPSMSLSTGATFPTTESNGIVWYTYDANAVTADSKLYADATEGWVAHAAAGLVFIKSFQDLSAAEIAEKEGDVELYTNKLHTYVEVENQGAYVTIPPGMSSSWKVTWYLRKLPQGVDASAGSAELAQFVRDTLAGK